MLAYIYRLCRHGRRDRGALFSALDFFARHVKELSRSTLGTYGAVARSFTSEAGAMGYAV